MPPTSRAALLLALAFLFAPFAAAEESGAESPPEEPAEGSTDDSSGSGSAEGSDGSGGDPVEEVEDCLCNETQDNDTEPAPDPIQDRAACSPAEVELGNGAGDFVEVDPDGCYSAAIKKAVQGQPPI